MSISDWASGYLRLHPQVALKRLEYPYLYHIGRDELYELNDASIEFLARCDGTFLGAELASDNKFVGYCLEEGLLEILPQPNPLAISIGNGPEPSLRYLELQLLHHCNLNCRHCYIEAPRPDILPPEAAFQITREFSSLGGLRLLISGGEPLLYPHLNEFIAKTEGLNLRRVLLTNGTLITEENVSWLNVEEIQCSLDGWCQGHDLLRGKGSFDRALRGIRIAKKAGIPISIATMIHQGNLEEFDQLRHFAEEIGAVEWGIDVMCLAGSLKENKDLIVPYDKAAPFMKYAYGGGYHGSESGFACGRHLMTVLPTGRAVKCGFYQQNLLGDARQSLQNCWLNLKHIPLKNLDCKGCSVIDDCAGGCRFRAQNELAPDPVMCAFYGKHPTSPRDHIDQKVFLPFSARKI